MLRIIIIDDNKIVVTSLVQSIEWASFNCEVVGTAFDGSEGLKLVQHFSPDIVITDIRMPGFDGLEMIQMLRAVNTSSHFIILTGYSDFSYAQTAIRLGVNDFILKPVINDELIASIKKIAEKIAPTSDTASSAVSTVLNEINRKSDQYSALISSTIKSINKKILENPSLSDIACEFMISPSHLSKLFKKETGYSFIDYLTLCKMHTANELLKNPKYRVYQVGELLGYHDYSYFYQVYKKYYGHAPSEKHK